MYRAARKLTNASPMMGARWDHADGLYDQPGGMAGPAICVPIGMISPKVMRSIPTSVSFV